jgi:hypothetical protein
LLIFSFFKSVDDSILRNLLTKQITHLTIDMKKTKERNSINVVKIYELIGSLCKKLVVLNCYDMFYSEKIERPDFCSPWKSYMSSTLTKLNINVPTVADCLYLLDGPFVCLSTLIIHVRFIFHLDVLKNIDPSVSRISINIFTEKDKKY